MQREGSLHSGTSIVFVGTLAACLVLFSNPAIYKIGTALSNFHFSTGVSHEEVVTVHLGPSTLQIMVPTSHLAQSQVASAAFPAEASITEDLSSAPIAMATPQLIETAVIDVPAQSTPSVTPVAASIPAPAAAEVIAPAISAAPAPTISVPVPLEATQLQTAALESAAPSVPADIVIENTIVESAASAPAAPVPAVTPAVEVVQEAEVPVAQAPEAPVETSEPPAEVPAAIPAVPAPECHPSYTPCLRVDASDYDCEGGTGNGPYYTGKVQVIGPDVFGLDGKDKDGWGCEA